MLWLLCMFIIPVAILCVGISGVAANLQTWPVLFLSSLLAYVKSIEMYYEKQILARDDTAVKLQNLKREWDLDAGVKDFDFKTVRYYRDKFQSIIDSGNSSWETSVNTMPHISITSRKESDENNIDAIVNE